jgi:hypothetical protein
MFVAHNITIQSKTFCVNHDLKGFIYLFLKNDYKNCYRKLVSKGIDQFQSQNYLYQRVNDCFKNGSQIIFLTFKVWNLKDNDIFLLF